MTDWFDGSNLSFEPGSRRRNRHAAAPATSVQASQVVGSGMFCAAVDRNLGPGQTASPHPVQAEPAYVEIQNPLEGSSPGILLKFVIVNSSWGWAASGIEGQVSRELGQGLAELVGQSVRRGSRVVFRDREAVDARAGGSCRRGRRRRPAAHPAGWGWWVDRGDRQRDRLVAAQVGRVIAGRRSGRVAIGLAERGVLTVGVLERVDADVEGVGRGVVVRPDVLDAPPRDPSVRGDPGRLADVQRSCCSPA